MCFPVSSCQMDMSQNSVLETKRSPFRPRGLTHFFPLEEKQEKGCPAEMCGKRGCEQHKLEVSNMRKYS